MFDYSKFKIIVNRLAKFFVNFLFHHGWNYTPIPSGLIAGSDRRRAPHPLPAFQQQGGIAAQGDRARIFLHHNANHLAELPNRCGQSENQENRHSVSV